MRLLRSVTLFMCLVLPLSIAAGAQSFKFHSVGFVAPNAINNSGTIAGSFCCSYVSAFDGPAQQNHGFSLQTNGSQVFKVAEPEGGPWSFATGIAPNGDVVGGFCPHSSSCASGAAMHAYLFYNSSNSAGQIDVPGAQATLAGGINRVEQIVGMFCSTTTCSLDYASSSQGFLLDHVGGAFTMINFPGALGTAATAINDAGEIVGNYSVCKGSDVESKVLQPPCTFIQQHGFLLSGGTYTTVDPSGSIGTMLGGINNSGEISGSYIDASSKTHGFVFSSGVFTIVDYPGASGTEVYGVNDKGQIVGSAQIASGATENFIGSPE